MTKAGERLLDAGKEADAMTTETKPYDMISSRPVPEGTADVRHLVNEMAAIHRSAGMAEIRVTLEGGYVWVEGWRERPGVVGEWPPFEPAYVAETPPPSPLQAE